jgi:hypothetical protein
MIFKVDKHTATCECRIGECFVEVVGPAYQVEHCEHSKIIGDGWPVYIGGHLYGEMDECDGPRLVEIGGDE